ncbi:MAG TPA: ABC transporter permease [Longimicrobiales bacterium]|nr:ABC transporter permease [Longimicrobiales bacterium]
MPILELLRQFRHDMRTQRLRTILTVMGIAWGTVAVVVLLAFGTGLSRQMKTNALGLGDGIVIMSGGRTTRPFEGFPEGRAIRLTEVDAEILRREIPTLTEISPEYGQSTRVSNGPTGANPYVTGILPEYAVMRNIHVRGGGRFINALDLDQRRRVAVLGNGLDSLLFKGEDAVGREVRIGEVPFIVVGVMQPKTQNSSYQARDQDRVFIPASTHRALFGQQYIRHIVYRAGDPEETKAAERQVFEILGRRHKFDAADRTALNVWDTNEQMRMFKYLFLGFNMFLGIVGAFTLTVGGIGVANIMYIVVRERTAEIGIRRSVGARRRDILRQFIAETFVVVGLGAAAGTVLSAGIIALGTMAPFQEEIGRPVVSLPVAAATMGLLAGIAFMAGLFPARKAASMDPVECLRTGI